MTSSKLPAWPILTRYNRTRLRRVALPIGGIGTGTVSLGGRGDLRDWEIVNRPAKGFYPPVPGVSAPGAFFALRVKAPGSAPVTRSIEGPIDEADYEASHGVTIPNHGMPKFRNCEFAAAYPLGQVFLSDPELPANVTLQAFNPLVPGDADASGIPVAVLRYIVTNRTSRKLEASVCGSLPNFIGTDGSNPSGNQCDGRPDFMARLKDNRNEFRSSPGLHGIYGFNPVLDPGEERWGSLAISVIGENDRAVTSRVSWPKLGWGESMLDFWRDLSEDGRLGTGSASTEQLAHASLCVSFGLAPRASRAVTFLLTWHFPNRMTWTPAPEKKDPAAAPCAGDCNCPATPSSNPNWVGNYYTTRYRDAWEVAEKTAAALPDLEARTLQFVNAFCSSDLPPAVKEAALYNVSTLRTQTTFRTADGLPYGWEGCHDHAGCCMGSCTHVWNYENAMGFLFGDLARLARRIEFEHATADNGLMSFRVHLPIARGTESGKAAADGQMGTIMRAYREWQLSGDEAFLKAVWPGIRRSLEFCWIPGGWDADQDGVMEGCQHNTMDVEYYGPNPQMGLWYLGALRAAEEMARQVGEVDFASTCRRLFEQGRQWIDRNLFNGEYYEHQIRPPASSDAVAPGLRAGMGSRDIANPDFQLGSGCLVDQLVGQYMAHAVGLGYLVDPDHIRTTLRSIMKYNFRRDFFGHFNHMRTFVLNDESALLMASYPRGEIRSPFPYETEVMTGFEYTAAAGMLYEGMTRDGLTCIRAIRKRYDGRRRNPFNEAECGHHYARAMASWTPVLALTGFGYSAVTRTITFAARPGLHFWSSGSAWGTCRIRRQGKAMSARIEVLHGSLDVKRFVLQGWGCASIAAPISTRKPRVDVCVAKGAAV